MATFELLNPSSWTQPHPILSAVQHIRKMRGGSQAHLLLADNGNFYITKFQNNPQHVKVLANEFLATRLARWFGLPVPDVEIVSVPNSFIEDSPGLRIETLNGCVRCTSGLQLGVRYAADIWQNRLFDYITEPELDTVINKQDFWKILALDKWLGNCDGRQAVFTRLSNSQEYCATFIDQGYCFNGAEWTFPDLPLHGAFHRYSVYAGVIGWKSFEPTLSQIETFDCEILWQLASTIPPEWYQYDQNALSALIESLTKRRSIVRNLISRFRDCSHRPFPIWTRAINLNRRVV